MAGLDVLMERVAERGTPRGADAVLEAARTPAESPRPDRVPHPRRTGVLAAAGAAALVVAVTVAIALAGTFGDTRSPQSGNLPRGITREQLDAHLGKGVPQGWVPVDYGAARLFVPPDWNAYSAGSAPCATGPGDVFLGGRDPSSYCPAAVSVSDPPPTITIESASGAAPASPWSRTAVHGYLAFQAPLYGCKCRQFVVPGLGVQISGSVPLSGNQEVLDRVLATLAPSARTVARAYARQVSLGGREVTLDGLRMKVPRGWPEVTAGASNASCGDLHPHGAPPQVVRVDPSIPAFPEFCADLMAASRQQDGIAASTGTAVEQVARATVMTARHGDSTVVVYDSGDDGRTLVVRVTRDASALVHELTIGLGPDGRVAGSILASLRAVS